jgi:serine/threonine protein phosphatase 1
MRTFVMGDIHGTFKALRQCLQQCNFDYDADYLIQLGDITDGYDEVDRCVDELLTIKNLIAIRGNHDAWFNDFIQTGEHSGHWDQGGKATALSYLRRAGREPVVRQSGEGLQVNLLPEDVPAAHRNFFAQQRIYYLDDRDNCYVHAGFNRHLPFAGQPDYLYYWDRTLWNDAVAYQGFRNKNRKTLPFQVLMPFNHIFIGHTPTLHWKTDVPMHAAHIINLDTGAGHNGKLTIMDLETLKYWQSDPVKTLYETAYR